MFDYVKPSNSYINLERITSDNMNSSESYLIHHVLKAVKEGLVPYDPGIVEIFVSNHVEDGKVLVVETERFPRWVFSTRIHTMDRIDYELYRICKEAKVWFRDRPLYDIPDNIILGSD